MALKEEHKDLYKTLVASFERLNVSLMECRDAKTGEYVAVICAFVADRSGRAGAIMPIARLFDGDPFLEVIPYTDPAVGKIPVVTQEVSVETVAPTAPPAPPAAPPPPDYSKLPAPLQTTLLALDDGQIDGEALVAAYQALIDDGSVWDLARHREIARDFIQGGLCTGTIPDLDDKSKHPSQRGV